MSLLAITGLGVAYDGRAAVADVSLAVAPGEIVGLVGGSGSGKSTVALAAVGLLPHAAEVTGEVVVAGQRLALLAERERDRLRGGVVGSVFQDPAAALNPAMTIGAQVAETVRRHTPRSGRAAREAAAAALARVGLGEVPPSRYPHQLSGGQRQRAAIAVAVAAGPRLLIADEPTAALDVLARARVAALLRALVAEGMGLLVVSHDLALVAGLADRIAVLHAGRLVETGPAAEVLRAPAADYTRRLVARARHVPPRPPVADAPPLLEVDAVTRRYPGGWRQPPVAAVAAASFAVRPGETVGIVGESGAGKSTLVRAVLGLERPDAGAVRLRGAPLARPDRAIQAVFQDPADSFDPRWPVARIVAEPLYRLPGLGRDERVAAALGEVGLAPALGRRLPHQLSGGERQRVAIARALVAQPALVVLDEALSALDAAARADLLDLLAGLSERLGLAYLLVGHDLALMRRFAHRLVVMRAGRIVEQGPTARLLAAPRHPYTAELLAATPDLDRLLA